MGAPNGGIRRGDAVTPRHRPGAAAQGWCRWGGRLYWLLRRTGLALATEKCALPAVSAFPPHSVWAEPAGDGRPIGSRSPGSSRRSGAGCRGKGICIRADQRHHAGSDGARRNLLGPAHWASHDRRWRGGTDPRGRNRLSPFPGRAVTSRAKLDALFDSLGSIEPGA